MAVEIVDFPIENGDFPLQTVSSPEGNNADFTHLFVGFPQGIPMGIIQEKLCPPPLGPPDMAQAS